MNKTLMNKIEQGRQYRKMLLEVKEVEQNAEESYIVRGYATTFNEPYTLYEDEDLRIDEQVSRDAFAECDMSDVIMQYDHEGRVYARLSNNTLRLFQDDHGLLIEADLGGTEAGRQLFEEIKGGYTNKMSFGFTVTGDEISEVKGGAKAIYLRTITRIGKLYDVSAVSLPANDGTEISARSFCDGVIAAAKEAERLRAERKAKTDEITEHINKLLEV